MGELQAQLKQLMTAVEKQMKILDVRILLALQGLAVVLILSGLYLFTVAKTKQENMQLKEAIFQQRQVLTTMTERSKMLPKLEEQVRLLSEKEAQGGYFIPPVPRFLQNLGDQTRHLNLKVIQVNLGNSQFLDGGAQIQEAPVTIELLADYFSIQEYLRNLYALSALHTLEKVTFTQNKVLEPYTLRATLSLKFYYISPQLRVPASMAPQTPPTPAPGGAVPSPQVQGGAQQQQPPTEPASGGTPVPQIPQNPNSPAEGRTP